MVEDGSQGKPRSEERIRVVSVMEIYQQLGLFRRWGGFSAQPDLGNPFKPSFDWEG